MQGHKVEEQIKQRDERHSQRTKIIELTEECQRLRKENVAIKLERDKACGMLENAIKTLNDAIKLYEGVRRPAAMLDYLPYQALVKVDDTTKKQWEKLKDGSQIAYLPLLNLFIFEVNKLLKAIYPYQEEYKLHEFPYLPVEKGSSKPLGRCHGIGLYWGKLFIRQIETHYTEQVQRMLVCCVEDLKNSLELFSTFIFNIQRGQEPNVYINKKLTQNNIAAILGIQSVATFEREFTQTELELFIKKEIKDNQLTCITGEIKIEKETKWHSIIIGTREWLTKGELYHLFNSNYKRPRAKIIISQAFLAEKIKNCFSKRFGIKLPQDGKLNLHIEIASFPANKPTSSVLPINDIKLPVSQPKLAEKKPEAIAVTIKTEAGTAEIPEKISYNCTQRFFSRLRSFPILGTLFSSGNENKQNQAIRI